MHVSVDDRSARRGGGAFTLLDLLLSLAIMATVVAVAAPRYAASQTRYRADLAARRIVADLDLIRVRARAQGTYESAQFYTDSDCYRMITDPDLNDQTQEYYVHLNEEPYRADIVAARFDNGTRSYMRYGDYGQPYWGGYVIVQVGEVRRKVVVDSVSGEAWVE